MKLSSLEWIILLLSTSLSQLSDAHFRFVCPRPQSPNTLIKQSPCGNYPADNKMDVTELTPGPFTLHLEDSQNHLKCPMRVALFRGNDRNKNCTLLDQIPKDSLAGHTNTDQCRFGSTSYPIGHCYRSFTRVTVNIPDIECDDCVISVVSVMADFSSSADRVCRTKPIEGYGAYHDTGIDGCLAYFTCTNVKIRPTAAGRGKGLEACSDYRSNWFPGQTWPYTEDTDATRYRFGIYSQKFNHILPFSPMGYLTGPEFVGPSASYPWVAEPVGVCALEESFQVGYVESGNQLSSMVAVSQLERRVHLTHISLSAVDVEFDGTSENTRVTDTTREKDEDFLEEGKITVKVNNQAVMLRHVPHESAVSRAYDTSYNLVGLVAAELSDAEPNLNITYMFHEGNVNYKAELRGPARSSEDGDLLMSAPDSGLSGSFQYQITEAHILHAFYRGWLYCKFNNHRTQISPPKAYLGLTWKLTVDGVEHDLGARVVPPEAVAAATHNSTHLIFVMTISRLGSHKMEKLMLMNASLINEQIILPSVTRMSDRDSTLVHVEFFLPLSTFDPVARLKARSLYPHVVLDGTSTNLIPLHNTVTTSTTTLPSITTKSPVTNPSSSSTTASTPSDGAPVGKAAICCLSWEALLVALYTLFTCTVL